MSSHNILHISKPQQNMATLAVRIKVSQSCQAQKHTECAFMLCVYHRSTLMLFLVSLEDKKKNTLGNGSALSAVPDASSSKQACLICVVCVLCFMVCVKCAACSKPANIELT